MTKLMDYTNVEPEYNINDHLYDVYPQLVVELKKGETAYLKPSNSSGVESYSVRVVKLESGKTKVKVNF